MRSLVLTSVLLAACGGSSSVNSDTQARQAYLGLDKSISKSLALAFQGYDAASSANIPNQMGTGDLSGTLVIGGKVDAGTCTELQMTLDVGMTNYSDGQIVDGNTKLNVAYATSTTVTSQPTLGMKLQGTSSSYSATLMGDYTMTGDLKGTVTLDLTINGKTMGSCTANPPTLARVPGTTTVTGTATNSSGGMYMVNVTI